MVSVLTAPKKRNSWSLVIELCKIHWEGIIANNIIFPPKEVNEEQFDSNVTY